MSDYAILNRLRLIFEAFQPIKLIKPDDILIHNSRVIQRTSVTVKFSTWYEIEILQYISKIYITTTSISIRSRFTLKLCRLCIECFQRTRFQLFLYIDTLKHGLGFGSVKLETHIKPISLHQLIYVRNHEYMKLKHSNKLSWCWNQTKIPPTKRLPNFAMSNKHCLLLPISGNLQVLAESWTQEDLGELLRNFSLPKPGITRMQVWQRWIISAYLTELALTTILLDNIWRNVIQIVNKIFWRVELTLISCCFIAIQINEKMKYWAFVGGLSLFARRSTWEHVWLWAPLAANVTCVRDRLYVNWIRDLKH